jgi:membrane glycosyltransferase
MGAQPPQIGVLAIRALILSAALLAAGLGFVVFLQFGASDGFDSFDVLRALLIFASTFWLAWGAFTALGGLTTRPPRPASATGPRPSAASTITQRQTCASWRRSWHSAWASAGSCRRSAR